MTSTAYGAPPRMATDTAAQRIADALHGRGRVTRTGSSWSARCPAHEDHSPSLSVRQIEGQALVHCHAKCATADVMAALGLTMADLYDERSGARYDYAARSVHRSPDKKFRQTGDTKSQPTLYRLPAVLTAVSSGTTVYLVEGEKDVHALESLGAVATTAPMGASNWGKVDTGPLKGAHVVVVPDQDEPGTGWLTDVLASLRDLAASVKVGTPKDGKDSADHVAAGHSLDELDPRLPSTADDPFLAAVDRLRSELLDRDALASLPAALPLIPGVLNRHTYALVTGRDGSYKTFLALSACLCIATGTPWHGRSVDRGRVLYLIGEGAYDFDARVTAWERDNGVKVPAGDFLVLPRVPNLFKGHELAVLLALIRAERYVLVVVDTLRRASTGADANSSDMAGVVDALEEIKRATDDGAVLVLAHTDKGDRDARGFSGIEDDADTVWHLKKDEDTHTTVATAEKMRNGPGGARLTFEARQVADSVVLGLLTETGPEHRTSGPRMSPSARAVLDVLHLPGYEDGASAADLTTTARVTRQRVSEALADLMKPGLIVRTGARNQYRYTAADGLSLSGSAPGQALSGYPRPDPLSGLSGSAPGQAGAL